MKEEANAEVGALLAKQPWHELKVVIMDPHAGAQGCDVRNPVGERTVDLLKCVELVLLEPGWADSVVVERPKGAVAKPRVVARVGRRIDLYRCQSHGSRLSRSRVLTVSHPRAGLISEHRRQNRNYPSGCEPPTDSAFGSRGRLDGQSIGDDYQSPGVHLHGYNQPISRLLP